ncbi:MAG: hypothetical protein ACFFB6_08605 [Promethearchaeota archaeon]
MFFYKTVYMKCPYCRFCVEVDSNCTLCSMYGRALSSLDDFNSDR